MTDRPRIPTHLAIIPDGNRRWARDQGLPVAEGHARGIANVGPIARTAWEAGVEVFSFWWGSPANLQRRSADEVAAIVGVLGRWLQDRAPMLLAEHDARFSIYGRWQEFCPELADGVAAATAASGAGPRRLVLLMAYDGREELAAAAASREPPGRAPTTGAPDVRSLASRLWTADLPDVDLVIRTAGEPHLSAGFLLWHIAEAQLAFPQPPWPAYTPTHLRDELERFSGTERRFGGDGRPDALAAARLTTVRGGPHRMVDVGQGRLEGRVDGRRLRVDVPADGRPWSVTVHPQAAVPAAARLWPAHHGTPESPRVAARLAEVVAPLERAGARVTVGASVVVFPPNVDPSEGPWFVDGAISLAVALDGAVSDLTAAARATLADLPEGVTAEAPTVGPQGWCTRVTARLTRPLPRASLAARSGTAGPDQDLGDLVLDGPLAFVTRHPADLRDRLARDAVRELLLEALCDHPRSRLYDDRLVLVVERGGLDLDRWVRLAASLVAAIDSA